MPGYANWKDLYALEYLQLYEEGYPVGDSIEPELTAAYLPQTVRAAADPASLTEADWEAAYKRLWAQRERGIRADFPFEEPNDFESIIADAADAPVLQPLSDEAYAERIKGRMVRQNWRRHSGQTAGNTSRSAVHQGLPGKP